MRFPISQYDTNLIPISYRFQLKLLQIMGQIFAVDGVPLFKTFVRSMKFDVKKLETSLYRTVQNVFRSELTVGHIL